MSSEALRDSVISKAREEAARLLAEAGQKAEQARQAVQAEAQKAASEILQRARQQAAQEREREVAAVERELRLHTLEEKNRLLAEAFEMAASGFRELPPQQRQKLYREELKGIDLEGATLHVPPGRRGELAGMLREKARLKEDPELEAGYIVMGRDFRLDRSLAARLDDIRGEMRPRLAAILFGDGA
jgi:vacuolar-type H+-ATPase subunit E/Vma4